MRVDGTHTASSLPWSDRREGVEDRGDARRLWIVITRPDKLPLALVAADALASRFPGGCRLLLERTRWWDAVNWRPAWRARFAAIHELARVPTCRGLLDLPRLIAGLRQRAEALRKLDLARGDLILCFAGITRLANAVVSACPDATKVLCVPERKLRDLLQPVDRRAYRWTTPGWLQNHLAEPLAGMHRTVDVKRRGGRGGDGARRLRFSRQPGEIFDACVALATQASPAQGPPRAAEGLATVRGHFPPARALRACVASEGEFASDSRTVVFFGTPFRLVRNLPVALYTTHLIRCLEAIRRWFPEHEKIYRPHPAETTESALLDLSARGFRLAADGLVAELYLAERAAQIDAVFSVSSTASRTALGLGLNAYTLWRTFPFQPAQRTFFAAAADEVPVEFEISDLSRLPCAYADRWAREHAAASGPSFVEAVQRAADHAQRGPARTAPTFHS